MCNCYYYDRAVHSSVAADMRTLLDRNNFSSSSNGQVAAHRVTGLIIKRLRLHCTCTFQLRKCHKSRTLDGEGLERLALLSDRDYFRDTLLKPFLTVRVSDTDAIRIVQQVSHLSHIAPRSVLTRFSCVVYGVGETIVCSMLS